MFKVFIGELGGIRVIGLYMYSSPTKGFSSGERMLKGEDGAVEA